MRACRHGASIAIPLLILLSFVEFQGAIDSRALDLDLLDRGKVVRDTVRLSVERSPELLVIQGPEK